MELLEITAHRIIQLFDSGVIPVGQMMLPPIKDKIVKAFKFQMTRPVLNEQTQTVLGIWFEVGAYKNADEETLVIERIELLPKKLVVSCRGKTKDLLEVVNLLWEICDETSKEKDPLKRSPIVETFESELVSKLQMSPQNLIQMGLHEMLPGFAEDFNADTKIANKVNIALKAVEFEVQYSGWQEKLKEKQLALLDKSLRLTKISYKNMANTFQSLAPCSVERHMEILKRIENQLSSPK